MTLTKRQKILVVVFIAGLVAVIVDRVVVRPQGAAAVPADSSDVYTVAVSARQNLPGAELEPNDADVTARLNRTWADRRLRFEDMHDPFLLPSGWYGQAPDPASEPNEVVAAFIRTHHLAAVVVDGRQSYALVDDHLVRLGQTVDGFTLVSVAARSAVFERDGVQVALELPK